MDPLSGTANLPYPVRIVAMVNVSASIILIIAILLGHLFYSSYGSLRNQGPPKFWVRPLVLSSVIFANIFLQVLTLSSAVPNEFISIIEDTITIAESCSLLRFFLASEVARNWSLVVLSMYTLFTVYKSPALSGPLQLVLWIITCIIMWMISVLSTYLVLTEHKQYSVTTCSIKLETEPFTTFHRYAPSACISLLSFLVLSRGACARVYRLCFKQSRPHERSEHGKWVKHQRRTTLVFQMITSVCFIPVSFVEYQVLDIFYYWLFLLSALLLKDVRELIFTFICYTFCSCCSRQAEGEDDKKSKDGEMANLKSQNGTQGTESKGLEEGNKHSCGVTERTEHTNQIEGTADGKDYDRTTDGTEIARRTKKHLEPDDRKHHAHTDTLNETVEFINENKTAKVTKLSNAADSVNDDFDSKLEHMNERRAYIHSLKQGQKESRARRKSKIIFNEIRKETKKRRAKKKKKQKSDDSTSDSSDDEQEPIYIDDENEELSDDNQNSDASLSFGSD